MFKEEEQPFMGGTTPWLDHEMHKCKKKLNINLSSLLFPDYTYNMTRCFKLLQLLHLHPKVDGICELCLIKKNWYPSVCCHHKRKWNQDKYQRSAEVFKTDEFPSRNGFLLAVLYLFHIAYLTSGHNLSNLKCYIILLLPKIRGLKEIYGALIKIWVCYEGSKI